MQFIIWYVCCKCARQAHNYYMVNTGALNCLKKCTACMLLTRYAGMILNITGTVEHMLSHYRYNGNITATAVDKLTGSCHLT